MTDEVLDRSGADLNFWPAFADLMLAVVFVLILVLFGVATSLLAGQVDLEKVEHNQDVVVREIAGRFSAPVDSAGEGAYLVRLPGTASTSVKVRNALVLQRITFSDRVLFAPDSYDLNEEGRRVLGVVGGVLAEHLDQIQEIQIQGHADTVPTRRHGTNVKLAALRAVEVFEFLQSGVGIDPASNLMSVTSFGEYSPVSRSDASVEYSRTMLDAANESIEQRAENRRIELLVFYRED